MGKFTNNSNILRSVISLYSAFLLGLFIFSLSAGLARAADVDTASDKINDDYEISIGTNTNDPNSIPQILITGVLRRNGCRIGS